MCMGMDMNMNINMSHREIRARRTTDKPDPESHRNHSQNRRQTRARSTEKPEPEPQRNHSRQIHRETSQSQNRSETRARSSEKPESELHRKWRFCPQILWSSNQNHGLTILRNLIGSGEPTGSPRETHGKPTGLYQPIRSID